MPTVHPALRPRLAATLLLLDGTGASTRVLLGRRAGGHVFMPNKWVFPGGRVDPHEGRAPVASDLAAGVVASTGLPPPRARAAALAAVRETFEETGVALGTPAAAARTPQAWAAFHAGGVLPHLAPLTHLGRAVTPPGRPRRFDTQFFVARLGDFAAAAPAAATPELAEIGWFTLPQARALDIPAITRLVLDELEAKLAGPERPAPYWRFTRAQAEAA